MNARMPRQSVPLEWLCERIAAEYREMPGMRLTVPQAARLWAVELERCRTALETLVGRGALGRNARGEYCVRRDSESASGRIASPRRRGAAA